MELKPDSKYKPESPNRNAEHRISKQTIRFNVNLHNNSTQKVKKQKCEESTTYYVDHGIEKEREREREYRGVLACAVDAIGVVGRRS